MNPVTLSQWQFAITTIYHFFFVPLTLGLSVLVAIMETIYVRTGNLVYLRMTKFWGKLFLINFAMGVVTGIVQEFQFGMNWSQYSRFVGDVFGAPLAVDSLLAFFLESTFLGLWIFGWDKLSKKWHLATIWLVTLGATVSAFWILVANSFMQHPVGYALESGRAVMTDFFALLTNPNVWVQFPHTVLAGFSTGAFFVIGISAYHLFRKQDEDVFQPSLKIATLFGLIAILGVVAVGHNQGQEMIRTQPMKMAAAESLWNTENPASFSLLTITDEIKQEDRLSIRIPRVLSLLAYDDIKGEVRGIRDLQKEYEQKYGPGNYVPPITITYWSFRLMVGFGFLMVGVAALLFYLQIRKKPFASYKWFKFLPLAIAFPYISNTTGWILTEVGRQPWVVFGVMKTKDAVSPNLTAGMVLTSLIAFTLIYGLLIFVDVYLLVKYARAGVELETTAKSDSDEAFWE